MRRRAIQRVVATAARDDYKLSTLVVEIAKSYPFRNRRIGTADSAAPPVSRPKIK